jgi:hypothetical protein
MVKMIQKETEFRFTDWDNESNDRYGTYEKCLELFNKAVENNPEGRYSIYNVETDEGVLFNKKCPVYKGD